MNKKVAKALCDAKSVKFGLFSFSSGRKSPVYVNLRNLPSYPESMQIVTDELAEKLKNTDIEVVAGAQIAGIPFAAALAIKLNIPMVYVRKKPKSYGTESFIEGVVEKNQKVILIDDVISDGKSKMGFIEGIESENVVCEDVLVILDREEGGMESLSSKGIILHSLITLKELLIYMKENKLVDEDNYAITMNYLNNPQQWNK